MSITAAGYELAWDGWEWYPIYHDVSPPDVRIDGQDYGLAPVSTVVPMGTHTVAVDGTTWDPTANSYATLDPFIMNSGDYPNCLIDENGVVYNNGDPIPVNYDTQVYAYYYP